MLEVIGSDYLSGQAAVSNHNFSRGRSHSARADSPIRALRNNFAPLTVVGLGADRPPTRTTFRVLRHDYADKVRDVRRNRANKCMALFGVRSSD